MERAVLFDMDGLLLDTERVAQAAFVEVAVPNGMAFADAEAFFLELVGSSSAETRATIETAFPQVPWTDFDHAWTTGFKARMVEAIPVKQGVMDVIAGLAARGYAMAVVTSSQTAHAEDHLTRAGLRPHFKAVIGGDAVSANKPDPAPYLAGAAALGVAPTDCVAFEDSDRGITAAVTAGCDAWQIPDLRPANRPLPDLGQSVAQTLGEAVTRAGLL